MDHFAGASVLADNVIENRAELIEIDRVAGEEFPSRLGIAEDGGEGLIQLMGERAGEFAEHGDARQMGQFVALAKLRAFGILALGNIKDRSENERALGGVERTETDLHGNFAAILAPTEGFPARAHGAQLRHPEEVAALSDV